MTNKREQICTDTGFGYVLNKWKSPNYNSEGPEAGKYLVLVEMVTTANFPYQFVRSIKRQGTKTLAGFADKTEALEYYKDNVLKAQMEDLESQVPVNLKINGEAVQ